MKRFRYDLLVLPWAVVAVATSPSVAGPAHIVWMGGGHIGVNGLAISPDQATLATCSATDNTAKLWSANSGVMVRTLAAHSAGINSCAFSPDGTLLATAGDVNFGSGD